jgi:hypothetical protein
MRDDDAPWRRSVRSVACGVLRERGERQVINEAGEGACSDVATVGSGPVVVEVDGRPLRIG